MSESDFTLYTSKKDLLELDPPKPVIITKWKNIIVTGVIFFLSGIENSLTGMSEWPYLRTVDKNATFSFFGTATSIANWGVIVFSLVFSFWNYRYKTVKWPLIVGRILATLGSVLYIFVEMFPNRRYVMLTCYIIFAISASSVVVLRVYIVLNSSVEDRSRAWSVISLANIISIIVGPLIQLAFSGIEYPGKTIVKGIYFNLFSAPIWIATVLNFLTIFLIIFALPEMEKEAFESQEKSFFSMDGLKGRWNKLRTLEVKWILVLLVIFIRVDIALAAGTLIHVISPMFITVWGFANVEVVRWISGGMGTVGILGIITSIIFMATPLSRLISSRVLLLISYITMIIMYILAFPYPFVSQPSATYNATTGTGCNPEEFKWCEGVLAPNLWVFMVVVISAMGLVVPSATISIDSIYSKVVGEADQSVMQGLVTVMDNLVNALSPIYASQLFTSAGPTIFWIVNGCITIMGTLVWLIAFHWMKAY